MLVVTEFTISQYKDFSDSLKGIWIGFNSPEIMVSLLPDTMNHLHVRLKWTAMCGTGSG